MSAHALRCLRCGAELAQMARGRLYVRGLELRASGTVWLMCDGPACGGHVVYHAPRLRAAMLESR